MNNVLTILESVDIPTKSFKPTKFFTAAPPCTSVLKSQMGSIHASRSYPHGFTQAWIMLLNSFHPLSQEVYKHVLKILHKKIIPGMSQPTLLMDFLVHAIDQGGIVGILALNGLFTLMVSYKLYVLLGIKFVNVMICRDYPKFYTKLYTFFDSQILHSRYRTRFFRLTDTFLSSTYIFNCL